jgi:tricorn protease
MLLLLAPVLAAPVGYYRMPTIAGDTVIFTSEGDLWKVPVTGGVATRLTSHPGDESTPALSPDGRTVAFLGTYEGTTAVYTMPIDGGTPTRWTWDSGRMIVTGWTPDGDVLYTSDTGSTLPSFQLYRGAALRLHARGIPGDDDRRHSPPRG